MHHAEDDVQATSRKRKAAADHVDHNGRIIKHRASKACQSCRTRKVRCDVLTNASRCTNCRLDELECVVLASRRGQSRRHHNRPKEDHAGKKSQRKSARLPDSTQPVRPTQEPSPDETSTLDAWTAPDGSVGSVPVCVTFDDDNNSPKDDNIDNVSGQKHSIAGDAVTNLSPTTTYVGLLSPDTNRLQPPTATTDKQHLPAFITPLPSSIASEDLEYLTKKGALAVPEPDLQIEILRAYLFSVHPFMPILDYRVFAHAVLNNGTDNSISMLLFQAVMFAGLHSLPPATLERLGFESAKQARALFFTRAKLLYEFDVEPDITANFQSLVLMSSWYSQLDARRDTWYWTGQAYDAARRMGLHREPSVRLASEKVRRFRRRLWWSLYIRDRMIALGTRRPMRIYDSDCDVGMLTLEDFDLEPFEECYQGQLLVPDAKETEETGRMCIQLAKLCVHVGHVVSSQYTTQAKDIPSTVMVVSRRGEERAEELERCERELSTWFEESCNTAQPTGQTRISHSCSEVHWAVLNMTYQTTVNVLHRTQALQPSPQTTKQNASKVNVQRSARSLTRLSQSMLRQDQLRFVGLIGVTAIIAAYLSHLLDITSAADGDDDVCDASKFRLYQSLEVLQAFRSIYASADAALSFLASVSQKAGVPVPMQVVGPTVGLPSTPSMSMAVGRSIRGVNNVSGQGAYQHMGRTPVLTEQPEQQQQQSQSWYGLSFAEGTGFPNTPALNGLGSTNQGSALAQGNLNFGDTSTADWASLLTWDNSENGLDTGLMSFNHDFYIDAFGFTDVG